MAVHYDGDLWRKARAAWLRGWCKGSAPDASPHGTAAFYRALGIVCRLRGIRRQQVTRDNVLASDLGGEA